MDPLTDATGLPEKFGFLGLTYDDVLLLPGASDVVPSEVDGDPALVGARAIATERLRDLVLDAGDRTARTSIDQLTHPARPAPALPLPRTAEEVH